MDIEKKVLIGINLNFEASFILRRAASFFRENSAKFYIMHVVLPDMIPFIVGENAKLKTERNEEIVGRIESELKNSGLYYLNYEIIVSYGIPAREMIAFSKKEAIDLITIGTHQKFGFKEIFSGSASYSVAKNSICPVLLIPLKRVIKSLENKEVAEDILPVATNSAIYSQTK